MRELARWMLAAALPMALASCGPEDLSQTNATGPWALEPEPPGPGVPLPPGPGLQHASAFVGRWVFHHGRPIGGAIPSATYQLRPGGRLELIEDQGMRPQAHYCPDLDPTAPRRSCPGRERFVCSPGERWRSQGVGRLILVAECADGYTREIELQLADPTPPYGAWGTPAQLLRVGAGEAGWTLMDASGAPATLYLSRCDPRADFCPRPEPGR